MNYLIKTFLILQNKIEEVNDLKDYRKIKNYLRKKIINYCY